MLFRSCVGCVWCWVAVFGDAFWAERALSLACLLLTLIVGRHILRATGSAVPTWWWCLLVLVMPITTHVAKNGYLEAQLTLLMFVGVLAGWQAYVHTGWRRILLAGVLGACTSAGLLIKGPVGLLPLGAVPAALWFYHKEFRAPAQIGTLGTLVVLATAGVVLAQEEARVSLMLYLEHQVAASISGDRPAEHERAYLLYHLATNVGIAAVIAAVVSRTFRQHRLTGFWLVLALAATLPLLLSSRHYRHYLLPALPCWAMVIAHWMNAPKSSALRSPDRWRLMAQVICAASLVFTVFIGSRHWGAPGDHAPRLQALGDIAARMPTGRSLVYCPDALDLRSQAYLYRHHRVRSVPLTAAAPAAATKQPTIPVAAPIAAGDDWLICGPAEELAAAASAIALTDGHWLIPPRTKP